MARPLRLEAEDGIYHVLNRGNYRADIFRADKTKAALLTCLGEACGKAGWRVHAWCIMSNHYQSLHKFVHEFDRRSMDFFFAASAFYPILSDTGT